MHRNRQSRGKTPTLGRTPWVHGAVVSLLLLVFTSPVAASPPAPVSAMAPEDITIRVELDRGDATATVWTTDFSYDYVRINAEYRT